MVKGVTKQVVVVRCPDTKYFDQAIFMVRDGICLLYTSDAADD